MLLEQRMSFMQKGFKFDTEKLNLKCVVSRKHMEVDLCLCSAEDLGPNICVAEIKLHGKDRYVDAEATFESAKVFGEEIARRWNESVIKK